MHCFLVVHSPNVVLPSTNVACGNVVGNFILQTDQIMDQMNDNDINNINVSLFILALHVFFFIIFIKYFFFQLSKIAHTNRVPGT